MRKKIFVSCIIQLFIITPILATAVDIVKTDIYHTNTTKENSLGCVEIQHIPLYISPILIGGMFVNYTEPNDFIYEFQEINGSVLMNFSLKIKHRLVNYGTNSYFASRYTWVNYLAIAGEGFEYIIENKTKCNDYKYFTYYLNMVDKPLETNGKNVTLDFYLFIGPVWTDSQMLHFYLWKISPIFKLIIIKNVLNPRTIDPIEITIHPRL